MVHVIYFFYSHNYCKQDTEKYPVILNGESNENKKNYLTGNTTAKDANRKYMS